MPPLHPPHLHFHKLKKRARAGATTSGGRHRPAAVAKKGLVAILYKLRDVHRPPLSPPSPSPSACYRQLCYPPPPSAWPWPSCRHPRTSSFRARQEDAAAYQTVNTVFDTSSEHFLRRPSLDEASCLDRRFVAVEPEEGEEEEKELQLRETAVVCGVRSERLFFEPAGAEFLPKQVMRRMSCTIPPDKRFQEKARGKTEATTAMDVTAKNDEATAALASKNEAVAAAAAAVKEAAVLKGGAVVVTVESEDPYGDFWTSMAEMVAAHGLRNWEGLEELLAWYLKLNGKGVHGVIVSAFVDLLVSLASSPSPSLPSPSSSCITFEEYSAILEEDES